MHEELCCINLPCAVRCMEVLQACYCQILYLWAVSFPESDLVSATLPYVHCCYQYYGLLTCATTALILWQCKVCQQLML
jgi:hypothetical protein